MIGIKLVLGMRGFVRGLVFGGLWENHPQSIMGATENRLTTVSMGLAAFSGVSGGIRKSLGYY